LNSTDDNIAPEVSSQESPGKAVDQWKERNRLRRLIQEGRMSEALNFANKLIARDPADINAWHERAHAQYLLHDYEGAQESYDKILGLDKNDHYALTGKGNTFCETGDYDRALEYLHKAADVEPNDFIVWEQMGRAYAGLNDHSNAVDAFQKSLTLNREFVQTWHWLALSLQALGRYDRALNCFDVALSYDPEDADAWNNRGVLFLEVFNSLADRREDAIGPYRVSLLREALRNFDNAVALRPDQPDAVANISRLPTVDRLRKLSSLETGDGLLLFLATSNSVEDDPPGLAIQLENGVAKVPTINGIIEVRAERDKTSPDNALTLSDTTEGQWQALSRTIELLLAKYKSQGSASHLDEARELLETALESVPDDDPDLPTMTSNLAAIIYAEFDQFGDAHDLDEARELLSRALQSVPEDHPDRPAMMSNLAAILYARFERSADPDDLGQALKLLSNALEAVPAEHPDRQAMMFNLASMYHAQYDRKGDPDDLREEELLREALKRVRWMNPARTLARRFKTRLG
jgi:tetratricopeptide (TPR) repeat protein